MEQFELIVAVVIAALSCILGLAVYAVFFDLWSGTPRPRFRGVGRNAFQWLRAKFKWIALSVGIILLLLILIPVVRSVKDLVIERLKSARTTASQEEQPAPSDSSSTSETAAPAATLPGMSPTAVRQAPLVADHTVVNAVRLDLVPEEAIRKVRDELHILFVFSSYGSQITFGMQGLQVFKGPLYRKPDMEIIYVEEDQEYLDLPAWADSTQARGLLEDPIYQKINVVMWSWEDRLLEATEADVELYLNTVSRLESKYPDVTFVYMTGHVDGRGLQGNTHQRNEQIREFCRQNRKVLYDFSAIESHDPDGTNYLDRLVNEGCWYDDDGDFSLEKNWAKKWIAENPDQWFECTSPKTHPLNANLKAYAAWWLWARLVGWDGQSR